MGLSKLRLTKNSSGLKTSAPHNFIHVHVKSIKDLLWRILREECPRVAPLWACRSGVCDGQPDSGRGPWAARLEDEGGVSPASAASVAS